MGFKRTTEGRIFFQNSDASANDEPQKSAEIMAKKVAAKSAANRPSAKSGASVGTKPGSAQDYTQLQILSLLKGLNDKLKTTQAERKEMRNELGQYREIIEHLEEKSEQSKRAYKKLLNVVETGGTGGTSANIEGRAMQAEKIARETLGELKETRKLILHLEEKTETSEKTVSALKKMQQDQAQSAAKTTASYAKLTKRVQSTEERQEDMGGRIEETITQQARLVRKIDKSIEDRARFMRKIERIEETVLQTRDSLNAKAMVLLTDQGAAGSVGLQDSDAPLAASPQHGEAMLLDGQGRAAQTPFLQRITPTQIAGVSAIAILCLLAGWGIGELQKPNLSDFTQIEAQIMSELTPSANVRGSAGDNVYNGDAQAPTQNWSISEDAGAFSEQAAIQAPYEPTPVDVGAADDIGTLILQSDEDLLRALDGNSAEIGMVMNKIEPGSQQRIIQEPVTEVAALEPIPSPVQAAPEAEAVLAAQETVTSNTQISPSTSSFVVGKPQGRAIPKQVRADSALPDMIKSIEQQAFDGVPEAQHDLAAVYTAGHAGVRQDYARASYWFKQAADNGVANAAYNLGVLNHQGLGMKADLDEAIRWYTMAADGGHPEAQYNLGIAYIEGIGVPYEPARAAGYFKDAARQGVKEAAYNLGLIYENGLLGKSQPDEALVWYKTAADAGSPEAKAALEQLARTLNIKIEDINKLADSMKGADASAIMRERAPTAPLAPEPAVQKAAAQPDVSNAPVVQDIATAPAAQDDGVDMAYIQQEQQQNTMIQIQEYLMRLGLFPGPADGLSGPLSSDAIRSYQSLNNLRVDGRASRDVLSHMLANASGVDYSAEGPNDLGSRAY